MSIDGRRGGDGGRAFERHEMETIVLFTVSFVSARHTTNTKSNKSVCSLCVTFLVLFFISVGVL